MFRRAGSFALWATHIVSLLAFADEAVAKKAAVGVPVSYTLPTDGPLPKTYRVTLAITDPKNPDWILSVFVAGEPRTVTSESQGKFTEVWDGLDENFMPLPPGDYGVKGIYMPAEKWRVDGEYHTIVPRFVGGPNCWNPSPDQWNLPEPFHGDPCNQPLADVDVGTNGRAVFYWEYLENGLNQPRFDLHKPIGHEQFLEAFRSGGAGGGTSTCTDGESVWSFSTDGGPKYVYRADQKPFGASEGANRRGVHRPAGWVKAMACFRDSSANKTYVYVAEGGKIVETPAFPFFAESETERVDRVTVHDGADGRIVGSVPVARPAGVVARHGELHVLHQHDDGTWRVASAPLAGGSPMGELKTTFTLPKEISPADLEVDSHRRFYASDRNANRVYQLSATGEITRVYGKLPTQRPGTFDRESFIHPGKLATWTDSSGVDRLLVVEDGGPNRVTEWTGDGAFVREFLTPQTRANDGWAIDPENPHHAYISGQEEWLTRFQIDPQSRRWTIDAVWPNVPDLQRPVLIRRDGRTYLACKRTLNVFRLAGDRWVKSAGVFEAAKLNLKSGDKRDRFAWHDGDADGEVDETELAPVAGKGAFYRYHGFNWLDDLSAIVPDQSGPGVWRLAPAEFDAHGNPVFKAWEKVFDDPVFLSRKSGEATAYFGGNELTETFNSDWAQVDGSPAEGFYVNARGGKSFSANEGAQYKISRYVPDERGGYRLKWRVGRAALQGLAKNGEIYGSIHIRRPVNGIVSVVDQSRCGVILYTDEGLYVDTVFLDGRRFSPEKYGLYPQPGEFFAGFVAPNRADGKIYIGMGKSSPLLYELEGWSLTETRVRKLTTLPATVALSADRVADPPEVALALRGGAGTAKFARVSPALGGANLDGSLRGWESCDAVKFAADADRTVEARLQYDAERLYVRWHARLGEKFTAKPLEPADRLFSHERLADTVSLYLQGDPHAPAKADKRGRPGDVRIVFGMFQDRDAVRPVALGMYPKAPTAVKAHPVVYRTPVNTVEFGHVALLPDVEARGAIDDDGRGFVIVAAIPRGVVPGWSELRGGLRTMINFEATFAGHNKFWWSNADGSASKETYDEPTEACLHPGSWAPAQFLGLDDGVVVRRWRLCGPFGGPGFEKLTNDPNGPFPGAQKNYKDVAKEICNAAVYPPDEKVDLARKFAGEIVNGYWKPQNEIGWRPAEIEDLDVRVKCGQGCQVHYGATWVYVPQDATLKFHFQGHAMTELRWWINGAPTKVEKYAEVGNETRREAVQDVALRAGWNEVRFRGFCVGYAPFKVGLVIRGPEAELWKIRLADAPPRE